MAKATIAKASTLREQSTEALIALCNERQVEIFQLKNQIAMKQKDVQSDLVRKKKKEIARINTILGERQRG